MSKTKTPTAKQAILEVLKVEPQASVAQIAVSAGVGRSTAGKLLAQLESDGEVQRTEGSRDGKRRLPDLWSLAGQQPAANDANTKSASATDGKPSGDADRLKPGQLEPLVLAYLEANADSGPHGPTIVAKALERSSGAVSNCLVRLTAAKKVKQVSDKPRRYSLAA
jgi:MarR family